MMTQSSYSTVQLLERWEDRRKIQNLMGRYTTAFMLKQEAGLFQAFWTKRAEPCLGLNHGYYKGRQAVKSYYAALDQRNLLRTRLLAADFPVEYAALTPEAQYGAGVLDYKPLCNQIIEIAGDRKTAKAFWYAMGMYDEVTASGPLSFWTWGMFAADLIRADCGWKLWHLLYLEDVNHPCGESWAEPPRARDTVALYQPMAEFRLPEPTVAQCLRQTYHPARPFTLTPPLPEPYETFDDTFSYGY